MAECDEGGHAIEWPGTMPAPTCNCGAFTVILEGDWLILTPVDEPD